MSKIGEYTLTKGLLGSGTYGKVYQVKNPQGQEVAIKVIKSSGNIDELERELYFLYFVGNQSPFLVGSHNINVQPNGTIIIEMPLLDESLGTVLENGIKTSFKTLDDVILLMYRLLCGLQDLHSVRIGHFDLKPENIFLDTKTNIPLLGDFGLSLFVPPGLYTREPNYLITIIFRPPEMLCDLSNSRTLKSDIWSLGIIFLQILSNFLLNYDNNIMSVLNIYYDDDVNDPNLILSKVLQLKGITGLKAPCQEIINLLSKPESKTPFHKERTAREMLVDGWEVDEKKIAQSKDIETLLDIIDNMLWIDPRKRWDADILLNAFSKEFKSKLKDPLCTHSALSPNTNLPTDSKVKTCSDNWKKFWNILIEYLTTKNPPLSKEEEKLLDEEHIKQTAFLFCDILNPKTEQDATAIFLVTLFLFWGIPNSSFFYIYDDFGFKTGTDFIQAIYNTWNSIFSDNATIFTKNT